MTDKKTDHDIEMEEQFAQKRLTGVTVKRIWRYLIPYKKYAVMPLICEAFWALSNLTDALLIEMAIDRHLMRGDYKGALVFAGFLAVNLLCRMWITFYELRWTMFAGFNFLNDLRRSLFDHIQKLSMRYFDQTREGRIIARVDRDVDSLEHAIIWGPIVFVSAIMHLFGAGFLMYQLNAKLMMSVAVLMPVLFFTTRLFQKKGLKAYRRVKESQSKVTADIAESISGVRVIKAFTKEREAKRKFKDIATHHADNTVNAAIVWNCYLPSINMTYTIALSVILLYGGKLVIMGALPIGGLLAFTLLLGKFFWPVEGLGELYNMSLSASAAAERIFLLLDTKPEVVDRDDAVELQRLNGRIKFEKVNFSYDVNKKDEWGLRDIDFEIEAGKTVALVGPTGAGKSSIVNLVSRFYDSVSGRIFLDDYEIQDVTMRSLHNQMGIVLQENFLFTGTVMDNLKYGTPGKSDEKVIEAAKLLGSYDTIMRLADGFYTEVKERGRGLSQGERQLICFTRAYLADPSILILDEATSAVDTKTEMLIQDALERLTANRTCIVVAHRLSTIRQADLILVIDEGRIIERGDHDGLMGLKGRYFDLYRDYLAKGAVA